MRVALLSPGVIHVTTNTQYELSSAFMRMQEYYESANGLRGKFFTFEECMDVYAANQDAREFTYTTDWAGFNVPGNVVTKFFDKFGGDLLEKEAKLRGLVDTARAREGGQKGKRFYLIGTHDCLDSSLYVYHEHCHALWYLYPAFRKKALTLQNRLPVGFVSTLTQNLIRDGYDTSVIPDEINAYLATSDMYYIKDVLLDGYKARSFPWHTIYAIQKHFYEHAEEVAFTETFCDSN